MSIKNIAGDDDSSDNLAEFRKNLHSLLHKNDNNNNHNSNNNKIRRENNEIHLSIPTLESKTENNELLRKVRQLENKVIELEKIVELKNTKILNLSTTNVENIKKIQDLNSKISNLNNLNTSKDSQIDKLEKIIIKMQKLSAKDEIDNQHNYYEYETKKNNYYGNNDKDSDDDDNKIYKEYDMQVDPGIDDNSTTNLLNSRDSQDFESDINLNTQQLLNLDLDRLTLKNVGPTIYNSNKVGDSYNNDSDNDSELEEYLFPV